MSLLISVVAASMAIVSPTGGMAAQGLVVDGRFSAADGGTHRAVTFDGTAVPAGSRVAVTERTSYDGTRVELRISGVQANRTFGAHVHTQACGSTPDASGPHYQNVKDPKQPSTDPQYANAQNEVWLDFTTDARGDGGAVSTVQWSFRAGEARSVVVHEHATETGPGHAGMAGARLACVNVPFE
ncbi:superoxide dismutase family protein [Streptomyces sp. SCA3-4]|uniref:superoxide dismutase family protein n=1 Tax=Streptomyces sichuanensis TaxID=2871810 RepID=UPI001CE25D4F|nr:superoxide dismutase family protein [Streptomyces sichuanensis]MCA6094768.1 superoxide dismutase family protein [Streptomyces sichuanensis]